MDLGAVSFARGEPFSVAVLWVLQIIHLKVHVWMEWLVALIGSCLRRSVPC